VSGVSPGSLAALRARFVGMVFQAYYLIPELDARANVLMARRILGSIGAADRQRAGDLLERMGLAERGHHLPGQLSGGECQRVAIARALMNDPLLILADEPTGNLDTATGEVILDVFDQLHHAGRTILMVTHEADVAARCKRVVTLRDGRVVSDVMNGKTSPAPVAGGRA